MAKKHRDTMSHAQILFRRSGLSLDELGRRMGYAGDAARKSAWQFLHKTTDPRLSMLERFAKALDIPIADLVKRSRKDVEHMP